MVEGKISKLDLNSRKAVIVTESGEEINVRFTDQVNVEIAEAETMGTVGGFLEDLEEGYTVVLDLSSPDQDGVHRCNSVECIS